MAVQVVDQPLIKSVYRPMLWTFQSTLYPATGTPFSADELRLPTPQELLDYDYLTPEDVLIVHPPQADPIYIGQTWLLTDSVNNFYRNQVVRVVARVNSTTTVVAVEYKGADFSIYVQPQGSNFTLYAEVLPNTFSEPVRVALKPIPYFGEYIFQLDVRDILARAFKPITDIAKTDSTLLQSGDDRISMEYSLYVYEAFDVVTADNVITFTEFGERGDSIRVGDWAYNVAHPYHQVERDGEVILDWQSIEGEEAFVNYEMTASGDTTRRYLTYASKSTQAVRDGDNFFLSFIQPGALRRFVELKFYNSSGTLITTRQVGNRNNETLKGRTWMINVGPKVTSLPSGTSYYTAQVAVDIGGGITKYYSELMRLNVVPCKGVNKRWHYLNKLGGVDQFTFEGDETRAIAVRRQAVAKSSMFTMGRREYNDANYTFRGDWNRKVWATDVERKYTVTSGYLKPADLRRAVEDMFESPHIFTSIRAPWWTSVIILTNEAPADSNSSRPERLVLQYALGVDDTTQRR